MIKRPKTAYVAVREVGVGRIPRQPGQVRKEAALTRSLRVSVQPPAYHVLRAIFRFTILALLQVLKLVLANMSSQSIIKLRNIGPKSARMLEEIGISTVEDLQKFGSVNAYIKLKFFFPDQISLNFLWAMAAGLQNRDWRDLSDNEKQDLKSKIG